MKFKNTRLYLRLMRRRRLLRALRLGRKLKPVNDNTLHISEDAVVAFVTIYNEKHRIKFFLDYYRKMGVGHFIFIDNNSTDGSRELLETYPDVSVFWTDQSYRRAHFGMDWINYLLRKFGQGNWCLVVDIDEFLVYPHHDKRPIRALTSWLDQRNFQTLPTMLIDLYPINKTADTSIEEIENPFDFLTHFDTGNYSYNYNSTFHNLWIQGGVRARLFFRNRPIIAPALNKTPLIKWRRSYVFTSSTHTLLPRLLNRGHSHEYSSRLCGALLHTKFLPDLQSKVTDPYLLEQHYSRAREYHSYSRTQLQDLDFKSARSKRYNGWEQLERLGIISSGGWI